MLESRPGSVARALVVPKGTVPDPPGVGAWLRPGKLVKEELMMR